ncbi:TMEM175 family protein [Enterococcus sp. HY326]|uniref:TMEM175 family protein n=1 Tax=Enterococcus sp. HY326 TaxID=2971265 RepID=UPI0022403ECA|nr:TMEM175 family protein [Enterococcus sp. HY326]
MSKTRIEAFTDAVIAIVMTLLVLEIATPSEPTWSAFFESEHKILVYVISFVTLAIYWNNHHHMFQIVHRINGKVLWANNFLIFTLSLFPFATAWVGEGLFAWPPQAVYGFVTLGANVAYYILNTTLVKANGKNSAIGVLNSDHTKLFISIGANILGLLLGYFVAPILVIVINTLVLLIWAVPQKKIEENIDKYAGK